MKMTIKTKALVSMISIIAVVSSIHTYESIRTEKNIMREEIFKRVEAITSLATKTGERPILSGSPRLLKEIVSFLKARSDISAVTFYDSRMKELIHDGPISEPIPVLSPDVPVSSREEEDFFVFYAPVFTLRGQEETDIIHENGVAKTVEEHIGWVRLAFSKSSMLESENRIAYRGILLMFLFTIGGSILVYFLVGMVTRPLSRIVRVAHEIADGDFSRDIDTKRHDEIGALAKAFGRMKRTIQNGLHETEGLVLAVKEGRLDSRGHAETFSGEWKSLVNGANLLIDAFAKVASELQEAKDFLEKRVEERTADLAQANRKLRDEITERIKFFESMDKINLSIQGAASLEQMMRDILDTMLEIFDCDRAHLESPLDPEADTLTVGMERCKPEYPGASIQGIRVPVDPGQAETIRILLDTDGPVKSGPGCPYSIPKAIADHFSIKSFLTMALHPKSGKPWRLGLHQCAYERTWSDDDERLFREIGRRLTDGLTTLLAHRDLEESEERMRLTLAATQIGIFDWDVEHGTWYASPQYYTMLGYEPEEGPGDRKEWLERVHPDDRAHVEAKIQSVLTRDSSSDQSREYAYEARLRHADGTYRWQQVKGFGVKRDQEGRVMRMLGVRMDINERKELEKALLHAKKLEIIGQLAGGVAHEVRNPLTAILSISEALFTEKEIAGNPEYLPYIEHIRTQVTRLSKLMTDLLELGRPVKPENIQPISLCRLCADTVGLWNQMNPGADHPVSCSSDPASGPSLVVKADVAHLQQVMLNLIDNAAQCSDKGRGITLGVVGIDDKTVAVQVRDRGKGIPPEKIERVFEPFFSLRKGGTGLGLALVKQFIENMGGAVRIWNNYPPPGCTAELIFNLSEKDDSPYEAKNSTH